MAEGIPARPAALNDLEGHYFRWTDTGVQFLDILHGEPLQPGLPPRSVEEHPRLGEGVEHLRYLGSSLTVQLVLSSHGHPDRFTEVLSQHGSVLEAAPVIAIEADWRGEYEPDAVARLLFQGLHNHAIELADNSMAEFQRAQLSWLTEHEKIVLPSEYNDKDSDSFHAAFNEAMNAYTDICRNRHDNLTDAAYNQRRNILTGAYQANRQWAILGQLGLWLKLAEEYEAIDLTAVPSVPYMTGSGHKKNASRLKDYFGVRVETYETRHPDTLIGGLGQAFCNSFYEGRMSFDQINTPHPRPA